MRELLKEKSCEIDAQDDWHGLTPLMVAVGGSQCKSPGDMECIKILLDNNANAMLTDGSGMTALYFALEKRQPDPDIVELLMRKMESQSNQ